MKRLTREKDNFSCRIAGGCPGLEWIEEVTKTHAFDWEVEVCDICPFEKIINRLAEYEDKEEKNVK